MGKELWGRIVFPCLFGVREVIVRLLDVGFSGEALQKPTSDGGNEKKSSGISGSWRTYSVEGLSKRCERMSVVTYTCRSR